MATPALAVRYAHALVWTGSRMIVFGGVGALTYQDGALYNPANNTWAPLPSLNAPAGRYYFSDLWTGTEMIVFGGRDAAAAQLGDGGRYNPVANAWTALPAPDANEQRWLHTAIWTGSDMIVWGGDNSVSLDSGRRFDPATNSWLTIQTARRDEKAIWTGSELIFWGGRAVNSGSLDEGLRWDAATNSWRRIPPDPVMPARAYHTTIWSGSEMIVWGGTLPGGGRYNPAGAGTWTALPSKPEVDGRYDSTAIWTGTEMIIWGGYPGVPGPPDYRADGGRYDPATGNWILIDAGPDGIPGRSLHTAVWTGTAMIVWGGFNRDINSNYVYVNSGGRYNPGSGQWTATSSLGAPVERAFHSAVWTGQEMIVFGGAYYTYPYRLAGGGRYDPATDAWTLYTAPASVIGERSGHSAVWTGTEMIIWGGDSWFSGGSLSGGARYDPAGAGTWSAIAPNQLIGGRSGATALWSGSEMFVTSSVDTSAAKGNFAEIFSYTPPKTLYIYLRP